MDIDLAILKTEIDTDPTGLGYVASDDAGNREKLNRLRSAIRFDRFLIPAHEVLKATDAGEWEALSAKEERRFALIISAGEVDVKSANTRTAFLAMFGPGTATRTNLGALQTRDASRAEELFGEFVRVAFHHLVEARKLA